MALVVPTPRPDLVVKTRVIKGRTRVVESNIMCDSFWACILDDYLDDNTDSGIVDDSPQQQHAHLQRKLYRSTKKKLKNNGKENTKKVSEESDKQSMGRELETLLSDDHEMDQRQKEMVESPRSKDIVLDILKKQDEENVTGTEKKKKDLWSKGKRRVQSAPTEFEQSFSGVADYGPQQEGAEYTQEQRTKNKNDVFHYAPLGHGPQMGKKHSSRTHLNRHSRDPLPPDLRTSTDPRRVPLDPDDEHQLVNRTSRFRGDDHMEYSNGSSSVLPRNPSIVRPKPHHARPVVSRNDRTSVDRKGGPRVDTIDLTDEVFHSSSLQDDVNASGMTHNEPVGWAVRESKRGDADHKSRKLDRKEALDRIRAIKARLNTVDR
jgi:hypothetical protein